jgi:hypothetical protein
MEQKWNRSCRVDMTHETGRSCKIVIGDGEGFDEMGRM